MPVRLDEEKLGKHVPEVLFRVCGGRTCFGKSLQRSRPLCFVCPAYFRGKHLEAQTKGPLVAHILKIQNIGANYDSVEQNL